MGHIIQLHRPGQGRNLPMTCESCGHRGGERPLSFLVFYGDVKDCTQGSTCYRQTLYHWATFPAKGVAQAGPSSFCLFTVFHQHVLPQLAEMSSFITVDFPSGHPSVNTHTHIQITLNVLFFIVKNLCISIIPLLFWSLLEACSTWFRGDKHADNPNSETSCHFGLLKMKATRKSPFRARQKQTSSW